MVDLTEYITRFKGFWNEFKRSKRGLTGLVIFIFFAVIALLAPVIAPLDPMTPKVKGYYPGASVQPQVADRLCVPIWYKELPGGEKLAENVEVVPEHEFSSPQDFQQWSTPPNVMYDPTMGTHNGCIKISYENVEEETTTVLTRRFQYPYENKPQSYWLHVSGFVDLEGVEKNYTLEDPISLRIIVQRGDTRFYITTIPIYKTDIWQSEGMLSKSQYIYNKAHEIFSQPGNYSFNIQVTVNRNQTAGKPLTVYVDDPQMLIYGEAFGLLGTTARKDHPRDIFTMLIHGTRISFMVGFLAAIFSVLIGLFVGLIAGYLGGVVDQVLMRFGDLLMVLPTLPLMIVLVIVLGSSIWNIIGVLIFMGWMGFSRNVRSMVLSLRERSFVEAAKAAGAGKFYIIQRHILPNVFALVYITLATSVPGAIIMEASLAWLGLGDPTIPSWGNMFEAYSRAGIAVTTGWKSWYWVVPPGIFITLLAMSFVLIGFALDEILNPKLRERR